MRRLLVCAVIFAAVFAARPAGAQVGEAIENFAVAIDVADDGTLAISETIDYNFGGTDRHGIIRNLIQREPYGADERRYDLSVQRVTLDGGDVPYSTTSNGAFLDVKIGDADVFVTGEHRYVIRYTVTGAFAPFPNHDELFWDAIGHAWPVPIEQAEVSVETPAAPTDIACYSGPSLSTLPCTSATTDGTTSRFTATALGPYSGVTIGVGLAKGVIEPEPEVLFYEPRTLADAFAVNRATMATTGVVAIVAIGGVLWLARRGRDKRYIGSPVDAAMGNVTGEEEPINIGGRGDAPVEFVPPDGVRPGQVGTLIDERANLLDVTASIIDLAVRGHLTITETADADGTRDYVLERLADGKGALLPYETSLLDALFATASSARLSELKYHVAPQLEAVRSALYTDAVAQGWYRFRPDMTRAVWRAAGMFLVVGGIALTILVAVVSSFGFAPLAIVVAGLVMGFVGGRMPARTAKGSAMFSRISGFRRLFDEGEEDTRARFAEQQGIFSQYLPYAIVFGCADKWARAFEGLDAQQLGTGNWYAGNQAFTALAFASTIDSFNNTAMGSLYASQPVSSSGFGSSSSGFSGGGFSGGGGGGGGGSSW